MTQKWVKMAIFLQCLYWIEIGPKRVKKRSKNVIFIKKTLFLRHFYLILPLFPFNLKTLGFIKNRQKTRKNVKKRQKTSKNVKKSIKMTLFWPKSSKTVIFDPFFNRDRRFYRERGQKTPPKPPKKGVFATLLARFSIFRVFCL